MPYFSVTYQIAGAKKADPVGVMSENEESAKAGLARTWSSSVQAEVVSVEKV